MKRIIIIGIAMMTVSVWAGLVNIKSQSTEPPNDLNGWKNPSRAMLQEAGWREAGAIPPLEEGYTRLSLTWIQDPEDPNMAKAVAVDKLNTEIEQEYQDAKPVVVKALDNFYVTFLTNTWTTVLRDSSLIASNYTITVTNTTSAQNMGYLMHLRVVSNVVYRSMSQEFINFKTAIEDCGYTLDKAVYHQ